MHRLKLQFGYSFVTCFIYIWNTYILFFNSFFQHHRNFFSFKNFLFIIITLSSLLKLLYNPFEFKSLHKWINYIDFILKICCYGLKKYIRAEFAIKLVSRSSTILQGKMSLSLHLQPFRFSPLLALKQSSPLDIGSQWRESMARGSSICHSCFDESLKSTVSCNSDRRGANFCVP